MSQSETIDDICVKAMAALHIPKNESKNIRFLVEENGIFEAISTSINQITMNSILMSGVVIYIDDSDLFASVLQDQKSMESNGNRRIDDYSTLVFLFVI